MEFILDRLEGKPTYGAIISANDRIAIKEDKNMYTKLSKSKPLTELCSLMNKVEKVISDPNNPDKKQNYDYEFEKLLIQLKQEYNGLFQQKEVKAIKHNIDAKQYSGRYEASDEVEMKSPSRSGLTKRSIEPSALKNTFENRGKLSIIFFHQFSYL